MWTAFIAQPSRLGLTTLALCGLAHEVCADVRITQAVVDNQPQAVEATSAAAAPDAKPLRISSTARKVEFHFSETNSPARPATRLRYKLEGHDANWQDQPVKMRAVVYFRDRVGQVVGSSEFAMSGETPGWRGALERSDFVPRREQATAPARTVSARISFLSHGGDAGIGLMGVDAMRVLVESAAGKPPKKFDLGIKPGTELAHPLGSPANWVREGSRGELAQVLTRITPAPHPILAIVDDDPSFFGNWATSAYLPVAAGDRVTLEWQTAHSIGGSGSGQADYARLNPGSYFFRVAAAKANGELTGVEVTLPIVVAAPLYRRWETWLVTFALLAAATAWIGRVTLQRRMQQRLAEVEHQQVLERERARIARDLHDDIGAGLTEIAMQSDWVRRDLAQGPNADTRRRIERVCESAVELTRSVDEIVWAVNPANDTVERFANYLTQSTEQFLDAAGLRVRFDIPRELPKTALPGKVRHFLFLAAREALNNIVKHARADLVRLELKVTEHGLSIVVEDNGCGFAPEQRSADGTREGLTTMQRRMEEIGGAFQLHSHHGQGTRIELRVPLDTSPARA